jgi:hypothetical protein
MSRTKGSGWGSGPMLWQVCPICGKKRALYVWVLQKFKCTICKEYFDDETGLLIRSDHPSALNKTLK